jgi:hypothetical protein
MRRILSIVGAFLFLATGAFAQDKIIELQGKPGQFAWITVVTDRYTGETAMVMNTFEIGPERGLQDVQEHSKNAFGVVFSLMAEARGSEDPLLEIMVISLHWQFPLGADVRVLADGQVIDLGHFVPVNKRSGTLTIENVGGPVSRTVLDRMANAKNVQLKVGVYEIGLNAKNIQHLKAFSDALAKK